MCAQGSALDRIFSALDINDDGSISMHELTEAINGRGPGAASGALPALPQVVSRALPRLRLLF